MTIPTPARHRCVVCDSPARYFFSKDYATYPGSPFPETLKVDYWKCENCGFVISKTHQEMSSQAWTALNISWHHHFEGDVQSRTTNQPPYANQALALSLLAANGIVDAHDALDYAAGYGTFAKVLKKYFGVEPKIYDRYVQNNDPQVRYASDADLKPFKLVINSAMFEHVLQRDALDEVNHLVAGDGVLMLHTVVCENVPKDPNWFYLLPMVHTAFHTNKSMDILMKQWGYAASIYSPQAKSWFLFKKNHGQLQALAQMVCDINAELQTEFFLHKDGFVDYWKGF